MSFQNRQTVNAQRGALSPLELANRWGQSRQHIYDLLARGLIMSFKSGRSRLIPISEVHRIESGE
jgi:excisionase family DNA binding protein